MPPVRPRIRRPGSGKRRLPRTLHMPGTVGSAEPLRAVGTNVGALHMLTRHGLSDIGQMGYLGRYVKRAYAVLYPCIRMMHRILSNFRQAMAKEIAMDLKNMNRKQRKNYYYLFDVMQRLEWDFHHHIEATDHIPHAWHDIAKQKTAKSKVHLTMRVDEDVVRFFKSMGAGHLVRMNDVLRTFMHARLAGVLRGADTIDYYRRSFEVKPKERPMWGDVGRGFGKLPEATEEEREWERFDRGREAAKLAGLE